MGLFFLAYFALLALAFIAIPILLWRVWAHPASRLRRILLSTVLPVPFLFLSWPILGGRLLFKYQCQSAGYSAGSTIDGSADGYELAVRGSGERPFSSQSNHPYLARAVEDVVSGRVAYFELQRPRSRSAGYEDWGDSHSGPSADRYYLSHARDNACTSESFLKNGVNLSLLPSGVCLATTLVSRPTARWILKGYESSGNHRDLAIVERSSGRKLAQFQSYWRRDLMSFGGADQCPADAKSRSVGDALTTAFFMPKPENKDLTVSGVSDRLPCDPPVIPADFEIHSIRTHEGRDTVDARLSADRTSSEIVKIHVNRPHRDVVLLLGSYQPVVWKISTTPDSRVALIFSDGYYGQAVLGVSATVPVLAASLMYSPASNCSERELLRAKFKSIGQRIGALTSEQYSYTTDTAVVGDRNYDYSALVSVDARKLSDFSF